MNTMPLPAAAFAAASVAAPAPSSPCAGAALLAAAIETMLSLRSAIPTLPMVAGLSANHLATLLFPSTLRRLYVANDDDPAGDAALATLTGRAQTAGIEALRLSPRLGDFDEDLCRLGLADLRAALRVQLAPEDAARFISSKRGAGTGR